MWPRPKQKEDGKPIPFIDLQAQRNLIGGRIEAAIGRVLDHGQFILGPEVAELEKRLADFTGAGHVIAVSSGTDALLMATMALDIGPGDAVIVPAFSFAATAEAVALLGAELTCRILFPQLGWRLFVDADLGWSSREYRRFDPLDNRS